MTKKVSYRFKAFLTVTLIIPLTQLNKDIIIIDFNYIVVAGPGNLYFLIF